MLTSLNLPIQLITGTLLWLLLGFAFTIFEHNGLIALLVPKADAAQPTDTASQSAYFPRRGDLRRCFVTNPDICIFENVVFQTIPSVARDLSLDYRKSAFLAEITVILSRLGEFDRARMLVQLISTPSAKVSALVGISEQQAKIRQTKQSQQTLVEALQVVQSGNFDPYFKVRSLSEISTQYSAIGQQETSVKLLNSALAISEESGSPFLFGKGQLGLIVSVGLLKAKQMTQAETSTQQFLQVVQKDPIGLPISPSFLEPLLTAREYDFATQLVQRVSDSAYRTRWLSEICLSLVESGEFDRAAQLASNLPSDNSCSETLFHEQDAVSTAIDVIEQIKAGKTLTAISAPVTKTKQVESGIFLTSSSPSKFFLLPPYKRVLLLTEIAIKLDELGQAEQSKQILLEAIEQSSGLQQNSVGLDYGKGLGKMQISIRLAESKQFTKALEIAEMVEEDSYKVLAMLNIANQYIENREKEKALNILSKTTEITAALKCKACG